MTWIAKLCFGQYSYFSKTFKFSVTVCLFHSGRLLEWRTRRLRTGKASLPLWNAQEQNTWIYARSWWTPRQMRQSGFSGAIASKRWARYQPISLSIQCVKYKKKHSFDINSVFAKLISLLKLYYYSYAIFAVIKIIKLINSHFITAYGIPKQTKSSYNNNVNKRSPYVCVFFVWLMAYLWTMDV